MLDRVAPEIATAILLHTEDDGFDMTEILEKRLVCAGWKSFIDGVPRFWRNVNLMATKKFVKFQMKHAQGVRLNVFADLERRPGRYGKEWVAGNRVRIGKLELLTKDEGNLTNFVANTAFPLLRDLTIRAKAYVLIPRITLPDSTLDPLRLLNLHLSNIIYPISSLMAHPHLQALSIHYKHAFDAKLHLDHLITVLPSLVSLVSLSLGGEFQIGKGSTGGTRPRLPLLHFAFRGHMADLDTFFGLFDLAVVEAWRFRLDIQKSGVPKDSRLRDVLRGCAHITRTVVLRWDGKSKCFVDFLDEVNPSKFDVSFIVHDAAPCQAMTEILADVGALVSVDNLVLHGGPRDLNVCEPDDAVIEKMVEAVPNVKRVTMFGNGNSWERVPVVLVGRMRAVENVWRDLEIVKFGKGHCLGYVMADWVKLFGEMNERDLKMSQVEFDGWTLQASGEKERSSLSWDLWRVVEVVKGSWK